jgi:hypothetical protein
MRKMQHDKCGEMAYMLASNIFKQRKESGFTQSVICGTYI